MFIKFFFFVILSLQSVLSFGQSPNYSLNYHPPYVYHAVGAYVPFGYGYFNYFWWPGTYPVGFGYSFLPYYYYSPYYASVGAISYSVETDRVGLAWGHSTIESAAYASKKYCAEEDCRSVVWVQGGCAAIAVSEEQTRVAWGYADSKHAAQSYALKSCRIGVQGEEQCSVRGWLCSY